MPSAALKKLTDELSQAQVQLRIDSAHKQRKLLNAGDYAGAKRNRLKSGPAPLLMSADANLDGWTLDRLRSESQRLMRNSPIARAMVKRLVDRTVGSGMTLQCTTTSRDWNEKAEAMFACWASDYCDRRGLMSHGQLQRLAIRSMIVDGDLGFIETKGLGEGEQDVLRLQAIEAQRIGGMNGWGPGPGAGGGAGGGGGVGNSNASAGTDEATTVNGVRMDAGGRPLEFAVVAFNKSGTGLAAGSSSARWINAADFIFVACPVMASQTRGEPRLAALINLSGAMNEYIAATVQAAQVGACQAMIVESAAPAEMQAAILGETVTVEDGSEQRIERIESGQIRYLGLGEKMTAFRPEQPTTQFGDFLRMLMRIAGTDMDLPLELVLLDHSQSTAYAGRAALATVKSAIDDVRAFLIRVMLRRNYVRVIGALIAAGKLEFIEDWQKHRWVPPAQPSFEPEKDAAAAKLMIENNLTTKQEVLSQQGMDLETVLEQRAREKKMEAELDVTPPSVPGSIVAAAAKDQAGAKAGAGADDKSKAEDDPKPDPGQDAGEQPTPRAPEPATQSSKPWAQGVLGCEPK